MIDVPKTDTHHRLHKLAQIISSDNLYDKNPCLVV